MKVIYRAVQVTKHKRKVRKLSLTVRRMKLMEELLLNTKSSEKLL